jgi:predicted ATPase
VTFLFTDVEGSTKLLHELGPDKYARALAEHRHVLREAFAAHGGVEVDAQGDAFFVAFPVAAGALRAAAEATEGLESGPIRVRIGIHTGTPHPTEEGYVGVDVHRAARIVSAAHGGQILLSKEAQALVDHDLTDLGEHRLKDFDEPVWIFQFGSQRFPPLKTISNTNLPRPASSFVGREREVQEVASLLRDGVRLVTLSGPGGSGKTRLALEAAAELVPEFKSGVFWVGLARLRDPTLVTETIAQTLGAKNALATHIGERELLLVLDNFEQVVAAAPELADLLESCPNLALLVTSRELLRVRGEVEYAVPPLAEHEAGELFCARAGIDPEETVTKLCRRLDNLPLAVELAAASTAVLSPAQILERLSERLDVLKGGRDAEARQQTLRATIEWSHDLLDEDEQRLFARLAVFVGGCTLEAGEEVAEADLDSLRTLVDKSLLRHTDERFWMLETIRAYAVERFEDTARADDLRRHHAEHFLALAEEAEPHLRGNPGEWLDRLEREQDNLRAALDHLEASGASERASRLAGALWRFWYLRGRLTEGRRRLDSVLRSHGLPTAARAKALNGAAVMAVNMGDAATARVRAEEALALHRELGDAWGAAYSGFMLGHVVTDLATAQQLYERSVRVFRDLGDEHSALLASRNLARMYDDAGDRERARALHEDDLRRARTSSNDRMEASALSELGEYARQGGQIQDARSMLRESLRIHSGVGDLLDTAVDLCRFAYVLAYDGEAARAARLLSGIDALGEAIGGRRSLVAAMNEQTLTTIRGQLEDAAFTEAWEQGRTLTVHEAVALALDERE